MVPAVLRYLALYPSFRRHALVIEVLIFVESLHNLLVKPHVHAKSGSVDFVVVLDQADLAGLGIGRHRVLLIPYTSRLAPRAGEDKPCSGKQEPVDFGYGTFAACRYGTLLGYDATSGRV
ncbi:hypothetical protein SBA6_530010 [Candidatus Sulfopaludibacter sp. SbA6]|nr:hypothetical protein SBA6_530010 [Candidatus Sulfopaludibacter sp. SbA6]